MRSLPRQEKSGERSSEANLAQSLQQTLSQMLTSALTIVGVMIMMITISPLLALVAIVTIPVSLVTISFITRRSKVKFIAQWDHTRTLNAHVEEVFTGHALVKAFGSPEYAPLIRSKGLEPVAG